MQIHKRITEDAPDPRGLNRFVPRDLCTICLKCLERDPNRRFATAKEFAEELRRFLRGEPIVSRPVSRTERVLRWVKRNPAISAAALLTVVLAIAGPITATVIGAQRNRLSELLTQIDHIIRKNTVDKQSDANKLVELRKALDVWEGKGNPWEMWTAQSNAVIPAGAREQRRPAGSSLAKFGQQRAARIRAFGIGHHERRNEPPGRGHGSLRGSAGFAEAVVG
jgi:hypothetical protein